LSCFAKPNFIVYDEWFDEDLEKTRICIEKKIIKTNSNIHDFYYEQSNYIIGASENHLKLDTTVKTNDLNTKQYSYNISQKYFSPSNKKYNFFQKLTRGKIQFNLTKQIIYSLSIFSIICVFGFMTFFISQSRKNKITLTNKFSSQENIF